MKKYDKIEGEIWKCVEGEIYVSNLGRVLNKERNYILTQTRSWDGYLMVNINRKPQRVHRLVANAFIPNPNKLPCVDHINTDKEDNRVENLRWVNHKDNNNNPETKKHNSDSAKTRKQRKVKQLDLEGNLIKEYNSSRDAQRELGIRNEHILQCCKGIRKTIKGFIFMF